jgi:hypothetical protein
VYVCEITMLLFDYQRLLNRFIKIAPTFAARAWGRIRIDRQVNLAHRVKFIILVGIVL